MRYTLGVFGVGWEPHRHKIATGPPSLPLDLLVHVPVVTLSWHPASLSDTTGPYGHWHANM
jgi:hypothetical protein